VNLKTFNLSRQAVDSMGQSGQHSREVTQHVQTIDTAPRLNRFTLGIFAANAAARLASASIPSESASIARHGDSQAPAFQDGTLMEQGFPLSPLQTLHNLAPELASIASPERAIQGGGEGVEASARSQSSQYIPPSRKFSQCHRP
jgi:hypothetical protein